MPRKPKEMTMTAIRKDVWNTYRTSCYTHDVANHPPSQGDVHFHQVRKTRRGWEYRIYQSNGAHGAAGPVSALTDEQGEARWLMVLEDA